MVTPCGRQPRGLALAGESSTPGAATSTAGTAAARWSTSTVPRDSIGSKFVPRLRLDAHSAEKPRHGGADRTLHEQRRRAGVKHRAEGQRMHHDCAKVQAGRAQCSNGPHRSYSRWRRSFTAWTTAARGRQAQGRGTAYASGSCQVQAGRTQCRNGPYRSYARWRRSHTA